MIFVDLTKTKKGMCFSLDSVKMFFSLREGETYMQASTNFLREAANAFMLARDRFLHGRVLTVGEFCFTIGRYSRVNILRAEENTFLLTFIATDGKGKIMEVEVAMDDQEFVFCFDEIVRLHAEASNKQETYQKIVDDEGGNVELERFRKKE